MTTKTLIEAGNIHAGEFFRKKNGTYVYLRISNSAAEFHKLDPLKIHGVCFNGNMASVTRDTMVERCQFEDFQQNRMDNREWHEQIARRRVD